MISHKQTVKAMNIPNSRISESCASGISVHKS